MSRVVVEEGVRAVAPVGRVGAPRVGRMAGWKEALNGSRRKKKLRHLPELFLVEPGEIRSAAPPLLAVPSVLGRSRTLPDRPRPMT